MKTTVRLLVAGVFVVMAMGCSKKDETTTAATSSTATTAAKASTTGTPPSTGATTTTAPPTGPGIVTILDYQFLPLDRDAAVGERIVWTNKDDFPHHVKSDEGIELDSGPMDKDGTYSHAFDKAGTYKYHCEIHNGMKGTVTVK